jgi:hypothetical protein
MSGGRTKCHAALNLRRLLVLGLTHTDRTWAITPA